jgi:hypothetical protein
VEQVHVAEPICEECTGQSRRVDRGRVEASLRERGRDLFLLERREVERVVAFDDGCRDDQRAPAARRADARVERRGHVRQRREARQDPCRRQERGAIVHQFVRHRVLPSTEIGREKHRAMRGDGQLDGTGQRFEGPLSCGGHRVVGVLLARCLVCHRRAGRFGEGGHRVAILRACDAMLESTVIAVQQQKRDAGPHALNDDSDRILSRAQRDEDATQRVCGCKRRVGCVARVGVAVGLRHQDRCGWRIRAAQQIEQRRRAAPGVHVGAVAELLEREARRGGQCSVEQGADARRRKERRIALNRGGERDREDVHETCRALRVARRGDLQAQRKRADLRATEPRGKGGPDGVDAGGLGLVQVAFGALGKRHAEHADDLVDGELPLEELGLPLLSALDDGDGIGMGDAIRYLALFQLQASLLDGCDKRDAEASGLRCRQAANDWNHVEGRQVGRRAVFVEQTPGPARGRGAILRGGLLAHVARQPDGA